MPVKPTVIGKVTAVSGTTVTVQSKGATVYTVDATNAKITKGFGKNVQTLTVANIAVGDTVVVLGTVSGSSVTATSIVDGAGFPMGKGPMRGGLNKGSRGVMGSVTALNGSSFTVQSRGMGKNAQPITYIVNTISTTTFAKDSKTASLSDVVVGGNVMVVGTVDATAKTISATKVSVMTHIVVRLPMGRGGKRK